MSRTESIKARLDSATKGDWVYSSDRGTHDSCIHTVNATEEFGYISRRNGGVVGSSEWIWMSDEDGEFIANAKSDIEFLLSETDNFSDAIFARAGAGRMALPLGTWVKGSELVPEEGYYWAVGGVLATPIPVKIYESNAGLVDYGCMVAFVGTDYDRTLNEVIKEKKILFFSKMAEPECPKMK